MMLFDNHDLCQDVRRPGALLAGSWTAKETLNLQESTIDSANVLLGIHSAMKIK